MDILDRVAGKRLRRKGFSVHRVQGRLGTHQVLDAPGMGTLPPLVLLHGFGARATHLHALAERLQPHFSRVVMPDLLGHGGSDAAPEAATGTCVAEALFETLDEVLTEPAVVFGNSLGGLCALRYAASRSSRVAGAIVTSPGGAPLPPEDHAEFLRRFRPRDFTEARTLVDLAFAKTPRFADLMARSLLQRFSAPSVQGILRKMERGQLLHPGELAGLEVPVTVLWGTCERVLLPEHRAFFRRHLPGHCAFVEPEGYGHVSYIEETADLAERVLGFARGVSLRVAA